MTWDTHPHDADGFLYILQPTVVFAARVNLASASYPTAEIPYDGVTVGAYTDLQQGMTVLIGSTAGAYDRGRIYVRANGGGVVATASTLYIGYSSRGRLPGEVDLVDDSYITVVDLYEPWRRASRMSAEGSIYKDYELVVAAALNPICQMGGAGGLAIMGFVSGGALAVTDLSTAGSRVMATSGSLTNPAWAIGDGTFTSGSSSSVAPDMTFPAGKRWISVTHNDSNGRSSLPRRALVVALADADDTILRVSEASWRLTPAGVTLRATLRQRLDPADYLPGTVVIWLVRERRAGAASNLTGYAIKFAGWLDEVRSTVRATRHGAERVSQIVALDVGGRHAQLRAFASTMARESTIFNANQMQGANIDRYLWWYLHYHSFLPCFADLTPSGDALHPFLSFSSPGGSFSEVGDQLAQAIGYRLTVDSRGRVALTVDPLRQELVDRSSTVLRAIAPADIRSVERLSRSRGRVGVVRAAFSLASTTDASALVGEWPDIYAKAPGDIEGASPGEQQIGYPQLAQNASEAQLRTGQDYARLNALEDKLRIHLAHGGDAGLEPALLPWVSVSTDEETVGWLDEPLSAERCLLTATEYRYDDDANAMECSIEVERETDGTRAADDPIAGANTPSNPEAERRLPLYTVDTLPTELILLGNDASDAAHVFYALEWVPSLSTLVYVENSTGLSGRGLWMQADPFDYGRYFVLTTNGFYRNDDPFGGASWTLVADNTALFGAVDMATGGYGGGEVLRWYFFLSINRQGYIGMAVQHDIYVYSLDSGATWSQISITGGSPRWNEYAGGGMSIAISSRSSSDAIWLYAHVGTDFPSEVARGGYKSVNGGENWSLIDDLVSGANAHSAFALDVPYMKPGGLLPNLNDATQVLNAACDTVLIRSSDAGLNWASLWSKSGWNSPLLQSGGPNLRSFTYDGDVLQLTLLNNSFTVTGNLGCIQDTSALVDESALSAPNHEIAVNVGNAYGGRVNGFPTHKLALLGWYADAAKIIWTDDAGVTSKSVDAPSGMTKVAYVEFSDLRNLIAPAEGS